MICPVCGAKCVCRKATELCCSCHRHKARGPIVRLFREIAHAANVQANQDQAVLFPEMRLRGGPDVERRD